MQAAERLSLEQIRAFLAASDEVGFEGRNQAEVYGWMNQVLPDASLELHPAGEHAQSEAVGAKPELAEWAVTNKMEIFRACF